VKISWKKAQKTNPKFDKGLVKKYGSSVLTAAQMLVKGS
jgi:hypothetical protein